MAHLNFRCAQMRPDAPKYAWYPMVSRNQDCGYKIT